MSDPLIIQTLKQKRAEISGVIAAYQAKIAQARHDLAHINAVVRLVEGGEQEMGLVHRQSRLIADILPAAFEELDTRQLAERVMCQRKPEVSYTPLRNSVVSKVAQSLRYAKRRRFVHHGREADGYFSLAGGLTRNGADRLPASTYAAAIRQYPHPAQ